jgi:membrane protein required for beta-lactamase induction
MNIYDIVTVQHLFFDCINTTFL